MDFVELAQAFGAPVTWLEHAHGRVPVSFVLTESDVSITVTPEIHSGAFVGVELAADSSGLEDVREILLRPEGKLDRAGKALRINREVQLGDPDFDRRVYIESDALDIAVQAALQRPGTRAAVLTLLDLGSSVTLGRGRIVHKIPHPRLKPEHLDAFSESLRQIVLLRSQLAASGRIEDLAAANPRSLSFGFGLAAATLVGILVGLGTMDACPPVDALSAWLTVGVGMAFWGLIVAVAVAIARGHSGSFRTVIITGFVFVWIAPIFGARAVVWLNCAGDRSPAVTRTIDARQVSSSEDHRFLEVRGLHPGEGVRELTIPRDLPWLPLDGEFKPVEITTRAGRFGWEWIVSLAAAPRK